jgi:hypothetical protein
MSIMQHVRLALLTCLLTVSFACSRRSDPPAAPTVAPPAAAVPAPPPPPPAESTAPAPAVAAEPEPELPPAVQACNRKCSVAANHRQMEGFVRCEKTQQGPNCKTEVLTANDSERAACRKACEAKIKR